MPETDKNPFPADADRAAIWRMLVPRDIEAFIGEHWNMVEDDFVRESFLGISGVGVDNPDGWRIAFPTLDAYRGEWLRQAREGAAGRYAEDRRAAIFRATTLRHIEINGDIAVAHKQFDGSIARADGGKNVLNWQTLYFCRRVEGVWKLTGFLGYLPFPMGKATAAGDSATTG
jgi:hypothetical protein